MEQIDLSPYVEQVDLTALVFVFFTIGFASLLKGMTGFGTSLLVVPFLAPILGVHHSLAVLLIPSMVADFWVVWVQRKNRPSLKTFVPLIVASIFTIALGTWMLTLLEEAFLLLFMGAWLLAYLAWQFFHRGQAVLVKRQMIFGAFMGALAGFTKATTGISAPFIITFIDSLKLAPRAFAFSNAFLYLMLWIIFTVAFSFFGLFTGERFTYSLFALIPMALFLPLGIYFTGRIKPALFNKLIKILMVALALRLLYTAWVG